MEKIKVCDSIMGSGKTSAAIRMMNEEVDKRFIFITPFLEEVDRVVAACTARDFQSPVTVRGAKQNHLHQLLRERKNIAITHSLFLNNTEETFELIRDGGYTLVLDEVLELFEMVDMSQRDIEILRMANVIKIDDSGEVMWMDEGYNGRYNDVMSRAITGELFYLNNTLLLYSYPIELLRAFEDVYVLTYMFASQTQRYYFDMKGLEYEYIGTKKAPDGGYVFTERAEVPEYARHLKEKIHIVGNEKMNSVGNGKYSLSMG